jgi:hypothetical protein
MPSALDDNARQLAAHPSLLIRPERTASPEAVILNEAQRSEGSAVVLSPSSVATQ